MVMQRIANPSSLTGCRGSSPLRSAIKKPSVWAVFLCLLVWNKKCGFRNVKRCSKNKHKRVLLKEYEHLGVRTMNVLWGNTSK